MKHVKEKIKLPDGTIHYVTRQTKEKERTSYIQLKDGTWHKIKK